MPSSTPLSDVLGGRIVGLDLAHPLTADQQTWLADTLHRHGFIVVKNQSLTAAQMVTFARSWGRPSPHVIDTFHHPDDANILVLSNVFKDGEPTGLVDAGTYFHTDYSYLEDVARCTILHAQDVPPAPNGTRFANQAKAYADLPASMKDKIQGLVVKHHYGNRDDLNQRSRTVASVLNPDQAKKVNWVRHPLVRKHPFTGQPALYAVSGSAFGIEGMDDRDAMALIAELTEFAGQDRFVYKHVWETDDMLLWDNRCTMHVVTPHDPLERRVMHRTTIVGDGPVIAA